MPRRKDGRREVGATVKAKASVVTNDTECKRLFGTLWKTQTILGVVTRVITHPPGSRKQASLVCNWDFLGTTKSKEVKLTNVTLVTLSSETAPQPPTSTSTPLRLSVNSSSSVELLNGQLPQHVSQERTAAEPANGNFSNVTVHGTDWIPEDIRVPINGAVPRKLWSVSNVTGQRISEGQGIGDMSPIDYFYWMFPMSHLGSIERMTNSELAKRGKPLTTISEILRYFGVVLLLSRHEFSSRKDLWSPTNSYKYIPSPNFARIMASHRFEMLRCCIRYSYCATERDNESSDNSRNRWALVDDFVKAINEHREMFVTPSDLICVDESMSRWYGLGGDWIDVGLPTYRAIERKPENGCEVKSSACGRSGIMLRLEIVKSAMDDAGADVDAGMSHGTAVTLRLVSPWLRSDRVVCGDSYFASVETARVLYDNRMRFIGVVKTAHRSFPLTHLGAQPMSSRGKWISMLHSDETKQYSIAALMWVDRERRYFVSTAGTTLPGAAIYRERWRRVGNESRRIITETQQPMIAETYYATASQVDRHNRCRQDDLKLEKKFQVKEWSQRVNTTLFAICVVDSWLLYKGNQGSRSTMSSNRFYSLLAEALVDNTYMVPGTRSTTHRSVTTDVTVSGIGPHLTPTSRKRKKVDGTITNQFFQGFCRICKISKTKYACSACSRIENKDHWICHSSTGRSCFKAHLDSTHLE